MKKILLLSATILTATFAHCQAPNTWTKKADFGGGERYNGVGFSIGNKGYLGMGGSLSEFSKDFWEYEPSINSWTRKNDFGGTVRPIAVGFSIGSKGYIGWGSYSKDLWEYDPASNTWTQKADFGGIARGGAVAFSIGNRGYLGTGYDISSNTIMKDFWEYDPTANTWTQKADFGGTARSYAAGFSIGKKGYIGTGYSYYSSKSYNDFWEYDPVANKWGKKANFGGSARCFATGFSIDGKGYLGTGYDGGINYWKDFWEFDPATNTWKQKADFDGGARISAVGFSIGNNGYLGTGNDNYGYYKDFWEYTPDGCLDPTNLRIPKISDTCARLNWDLTNSSVEHIKISYRSLGSSTWNEERKKAGENAIVICGLRPNTTYEWKVRNICADEKTAWIKGPNFTTTSSTSFSSISEPVNSNKVPRNVSVRIVPNPNKGNFSLQMQLPSKTASTTLFLYNNLGEKLWKQDAGRLSGSVNRNIALESRLSAGVYVLHVQHGDMRIMQKIVVIK